MNRRKKKKIESAELARRRVRDSMDTQVEETKKSETYPAHSDVQNLDNLFNSEEVDDLFSFEKTNEQPVQKESNLDLFDDVAQDTNITEDSFKTDDSIDVGFNNLYKDSEEQDVESDLEQSVEQESEELDLGQSKEQDLTQSEEITEQQETEHIDSSKIANSKTLFMAMQVFDSAEENFDLDNVDGQMIFDTDDESTYDLGMKAKEIVQKEPSYDESIFDSSEM